MKKKTTVHKRITAKPRGVPLMKKKKTINRYSLIFTASFITAVVLMVVVINRRTLTQSVAGAEIMKGLFNESTINLPQIPGASGYNVYYKQFSDPTFIHALRHIPAASTTVTIGYLKKHTQYQYKISAYNAAGREFYFSPTQTVSNYQSL